MKKDWGDLPPPSELARIMPEVLQVETLAQNCAADIMAGAGISIALAATILADREATRLIFDGK